MEFHIEGFIFCFLLLLLLLKPCHETNLLELKAKGKLFAVKVFSVYNVTGTLKIKLALAHFVPDFAGLLCFSFRI